MPDTDIIQPPAAGGQPQNTTTPPPVPPAPPAGDQDDYRGAGSKDALKADLAAERDKRQALEAKLDTFTEGISKALGISTSEVTPEQMAAQLTQAQSERDTLQAQLAVFLNAPDGVDVKGLLDSSSFTRSLQNADLTKPDAVAAAITAFVDTNPRFRTNPSSGGDLSAGHKQTPTDIAPGVPRMAAALEQQLSKN